MPDVDDPRGVYRPFEHPGDRRIAELADKQHGVVATWQLQQIGYTPSAVKVRVRAGRLHRIHRGVYAVGYRRISLKGRWRAAVLACGPEAVLSHQSAAALWELRPPSSTQPIDVTVPGRTRHGQKGIRAHNVRQLDGHDRLKLEGIPVTSWQRTLLDYAEVANRQQLRLALEGAERRDLTDLGAINDLLARSPGRRGAKALRALLSEIQGPAPWTQSELERGFLALIREAGIPEPQVNVLVAGILVDVFWPKRRLVVEVDGYRFHKTRRSFEDDRRRDTKLQLAGFRVLRVTQRRIQYEGRGLQRDVIHMLNAEQASDP